jgi:SAM-dependent methyltransferase
MARSREHRQPTETEHNCQKNNAGPESWHQASPGGGSRKPSAGLELVELTDLKVYLSIELGRFRRARRVNRPDFFLPATLPIDEVRHMADRSTEIIVHPHAGTRSRARDFSSPYNLREMERMLEATALAEDTHFWFLGLRRTAEAFLRHAMNGRQIERLVDCGAGTGRNLDWLGGFGRVVGVELTPAGLRVARAHARPVVRGSVAALPIADASVDVATSFDVLYCLEEDVERRALEEMWRVLKPGGFVIVNVAALDVLHGSHSTLTHELRRYTPARLRERLRTAGFTVERLTFTNMTLFPMALALRGFERLSGRAGEASDSDLQVPAPPINALFDLALRVEGMMLRAVNLPIGTSLMAVARKPADRPGR